MSDVARGSVSVIGKSLYDNGDTVGTVALVGDSLVISRVSVARSLLDDTVDVVVRHVVSLCLCDDIAKLGVYRRVSAAAFLDGYDKLTSDFGKNLRSRGVVLALFLLDSTPFIMS